MAGLSCRTDQILVPCTAYPSQRRRPGNAAGAAPSQLMTESARNCAVLAEDAGALTGFTVALCNKLRRMDAEPQRRFPDAHPIQRVYAWPAVGGDSYRRVNARPIGSGTVRESHPKPVELSSSSTAQVTERRLAEFEPRLPLITIVATVRRVRRDLASEQGHASPLDIELSARHVLIDLIRQAPASFRLGEFGRSRWPDVPLDADRPCQTLTGFL